MPPAASPFWKRGSDTRVEVKVDPGLMRSGFETGLTTEQRINTHFDLARALENQGQYDGAITEYQKVIEGFESAGKLRLDTRTRARIHRRVGVAFDRLGKFDKSREHYQAAQRLAPKEADVWNDAGYSEYLQGHWAEAEKALRKAVELDPSNPRLLTNLGLALAAEGQTDAALESLTKAAGPAAAHANLAYVLASTGQLPAARQHYTAALAIQPDLTAARDGLRRSRPASPVPMPIGPGPRPTPSDAPPPRPKESRRKGDRNRSRFRIIVDCSVLLRGCLGLSRTYAIAPPTRARPPSPNERQTLRVTDVNSLIDRDLAYRLIIASCGVPRSSSGRPWGVALTSRRRRDRVDRVSR